MKNNYNRKTVPNKTKKNLSNFDKDRLVWRSIIEFPTQNGNGTGYIFKIQYSA